MTVDHETDAAWQQLGRSALMGFRGAREDGSLQEAIWATVAIILALWLKPDE